MRVYRKYERENKIDKIKNAHSTATETATGVAAAAAV